jgi:hypothetical protein
LEDNALLVFEAQVPPFRCVLAFAHFAVWRQGRDFAQKFRGKLGLPKSDIIFF